MRPFQFCNLSEVVVRSDDTFEDLARKVRIATILGTLQATQSNFRYLRKIWQRNTEEEALLGVSFTGIMDHPVLSGYAPYMDDPEGGGVITLNVVLERLKDIAIETNAEWAKRLGINPATAITCVKPSGTVSQLVNSASGIHPRFSPYYVRRVRADYKDPLAKAMVVSGFSYEEDVHKPTNLVFSFPVKAPEGSICVDEVKAIRQLQLWKVYQESWCEHKPSITVYYEDSEFLEVGQWVWDNFDDISGIAFLPKTDHIYKQAPYEAIDEEAYNTLVDATPVVDWSNFFIDEEQDNTESSQMLACVGSSCELP